MSDRAVERCGKLRMKMKRFVAPIMGYVKHDLDQNNLSVYGCTKDAGGLFIPC